MMNTGAVYKTGEKEPAVSQTAEETGGQNREGAASTREGVNEYGFLGPISEKDAEIS